MAEPVKAKVTFISTENIKPSSPTPLHLKTHKLSFLDQLHPTIFSHVALFYLPDNPQSNIAENLKLLKESLSNTLTLFYPLAGRIGADLLSIDCNDEGLYFSESRVNLNLFDFLENPDLDLLNDFYPCHPSRTEPFVKVYPLMIQVNIFDCSGIVIGMCLSHKFQDGISTSAFLKAWSASAQGCLESEKHFPSFQASKLFPPNNELPMNSISDLGKAMVKIGNSITRRFLFDSSSIAKLKAGARKGSESVKYPSGVEVVSAFIWKTAISVSEKNSGFRKASIISHAVDLRRRMIPPLGEFSIGNLLWIPNIQCKIEDEIELNSLVFKLRGTILEVNSEFVKRLQEGEALAITSENVKKISDLCSKDEVDYYGFTSWSKFGIYDINFGWGKPIWVSSHKIEEHVFMNLVHMLETKEGGGIEAWITLEEREMNLLLTDDEFLNYSVLDPSPLLLASKE